MFLRYNDKKVKGRAWKGMESNLVKCQEENKKDFLEEG